MKNLFLTLSCFLLLQACSMEKVADAVEYDVSFSEKLLRPVSFDVADTASYNRKVTITFVGDKVVADTVYEGMEMERNGASLFVRSRIAGVEYIVRGATGDGSLTIVSERSPLVTLCGLALVSKGRNALQVSSKEPVLVRAEGDNYLSDKLDTVKGGKNDAVMAIMGKSIFMGHGRIDIDAGRRNALLCTDTMFFIGGNLCVSNAPGNALLLGKSAYLSGGTMRLSSMKDVVKGKTGAFVIAGGTLGVDAVASKADAVQVASFGMSGGVLDLNVAGAAADGVKAGRVCFSGGSVSINTGGDALFSEKKMDYSSASCIKADSCVYIKGGELLLCSNGIGAKGVSCDGNVVVDGGCMRVVTRGKEAVHDVDLNVHASCKGIKSDGSFVMNGGDVEVLVLGKGERNEGVEAKVDMAINGGQMYVYAYDDAVNVGSRFFMNGGSVYCYSVANDAVDSNGSVTMSGGVLAADGSFSPEQGVDVDDFSKFAVRGGTLVAVGGGMGPMSSLPLCEETDVPAIAWRGVELKKGCCVNVEDGNGVSMLSYSIVRDIPSGVFLVAGSGLETGEKYTLSLSSCVDGGESFGNGVRRSCLAVDRACSVEVEMDELVAVVGDGMDVRYHKPGTMMQGFPFAPPPGGFPGGNGAPDGGFPPPPPIRDIDDCYSEYNLPNYNK